MTGIHDVTLDRSRGTITLDTAWEQHDDGTTFIAVQPDSDHAPFRRNFVITRDALEPGTGILQWQQGVEAALHELLGSAQVLESTIRSDTFERMTLYTTDEGFPVAMHQWGTAHAAHGYSLSLTCLAVDYSAARAQIEPRAHAWLASLPRSEEAR